MIAAQILDALQHIYKTEKRRIVFWYDPEGEFKDDMACLPLDSVTVLRLDEHGALEVKMRLEIEDTKGKYLLYAPFAQPVDEENWLLDIQLYSRVFRADSTSILIDDLGLSGHGLHDYLKTRKKFLASRERVAQLQKWVLPSDGTWEIDLKMLATTLKAEQPDVDAILLKVFGECAEFDFKSGMFAFEDSSAVWNHVRSYELEEPFWRFVADRFGYQQEKERRGIRDFLFHLMATDFCNAASCPTPDALRSFVLPDRNLGRNASVFLANWRSNAVYFATYTTLSDFVAYGLNVESQLSSLPWRNLVDVMTFSCVEKYILSNLRDLAVEAAKGQNPKETLEFCNARKDGHWARSMLAKDGLNPFSAAYSAIEKATSLFELRWEYPNDISFKTAKDGFEGYCCDLWRFDQHYRLFHEHAEVVTQSGWDILKSLQSTVDDCYTGWYLPQLALAWGCQLEGDTGLLKSWRITDIPCQHRFYTKEVDAFLQENPKSRVFVLISDALRYEAAMELKDDLLARNRFEAEIHPMLGVLPSYTALGMAALLPHKEFSFKKKDSAAVSVDGKAANSVTQRSALLAAYEGVAIKAEDLLDMSKPEGREFIKPFRIVYVYHDQIDAVGDKAKSEGRTFSAVRQAIQQLSSTVGFLINSLNASLVLVTADHGFIYTENQLDEVDKSTLAQEPTGAVEVKKRYIIGHDLGTANNVWAGRTESTAGMTDGAEFWLPKGIGRFHFVGGARYYHGGAMPQEVVVPVISAKRARGKEEQKAQVRQVDISPLEAGQIRITNTLRRFEFIQIDPVGDKVLVRTAEVFLRHGQNPISNIVRITFDSTSSNLDERKRSVQLTIVAGKYERTGDYKLVVRDADTSVELHCLPVLIDLTFGADF